MTETATTPDNTIDRPQHLGLLARFLGVIVSPRDTFTAVAARPRVLGMLLVVVTLTAAAQAAFLATDVGREAYLDQAVKTMQNFGVNVTDEMEARMEQQARYQPVIQAVSILVISPLFYAIIAGLFLMVFNVFLGGVGTFKQVYAILVHSGAIGVLQAAFTMPISYAQAEMTSATRLSVFFPMLDEKSFAIHFLGRFDFFIIWMIVVRSIG